MSIYITDCRFLITFCPFPGRLPWNVMEIPDIGGTTLSFPFLQGKVNASRSTYRS